MSIVVSLSGILFAGGWSVVYRSTNGGSTWDVLGHGLPQSWIAPLRLGENNNLFAGTTAGIFLSTDTGITWTFIGPPGAPNGFNISGLVLDSEGGIITSGLYEGVYRTTDRGATWSQLLSGSAFITSLFVDSMDRLHVGTFYGHVLMSTDAGSTWNRINSGYSFSGVRAFGLDHSGALLVGTDYGGVFQTPDHGTLWFQKNAGFKQATVHSLQTNSLGDIFARTRNLIYRSTDQGTMWLPTNYGDDAEGHIFVSPRDHIFASASFIPGRRSTDFGETWIDINSGICCYVASFGAGLDSSIYAAAAGFYKSTDNGETWTMLSEPAGLQTFVQNSQGTLFGGTIFGSLLRSTNGGLSWDSVGTGIPWGSFWTSLVSSKDHVFLGSHVGGGMYRTTDDGNTWVRLTVGLPDSAIYALREDRSGTLLASVGDFGVYCSTDNGTQWSPASSGLPDTTVYALINDKYGYLYAGLIDGGVYRTTGPTTSVKEQPGIPRQLVLHQNYPNPFNPTTVIRYVLPSTQHVTLSIYNILGQEVITLVRGVQQSGQHSVIWDGRGSSGQSVASGVYLYRLEAGGSVVTNKMILMK
jgi:photosystem II stability/assembly factor-like uncharacterized protein